MLLRNNIIVKVGTSVQPVLPPIGSTINKILFCVLADSGALYEKVPLRSYRKQWRILPGHCK